MREAPRPARITHGSTRAERADGAPLAPATHRLALLPYLLASGPALVVGVHTMRAVDVSAAVWGQNLAAWAVGALRWVPLGPLRPYAPPFPPAYCAVGFRC